MSQKSIDTVHGAIFAVSYGILCPATLFTYLFFLMYYRAFLPDAWSDLTPKAFVIPAFFLFCLGCYVFVHLWKVNYWRRHEKRLIQTLLEVILPMVMVYPGLMSLSFFAAAFPSFL